MEVTQQDIELHFVSRQTLAQQQHVEEEENSNQQQAPPPLSNTPTPATTNPTAASNILVSQQYELEAIELQQDSSSLVEITTAASATAPPPPPPSLPQAASSSLETITTAASIASSSTILPSTSSAPSVSAPASSSLSSSSVLDDAPLECYICKDETREEPLLMQTCVCHAIVHKTCLDTWTMTKRMRQDECSICKRNFELVKHKKQGKAHKVRKRLSQVFCNTCCIVLMYLACFFLLIAAFLALAWLFGYLILSKTCPWTGSSDFVCVLLQTVLGSVILAAAIFVLVLVCAPVAVCAMVVFQQYQRRKMLAKREVCPYVVPIPSSMMQNSTTANATVQVNSNL